MRAIVAVMTGLALALVVAGCVRTPEFGDGSWVSPGTEQFDYQLGGGYEPPDGVTVVERDSTDDPAPDSYNICYVNGFQTQPGEGERWLSDHPDLILHTADGAPLIDPGWPDEYILDTSTEDKRMQIAALLGTVISGCWTHGFDAVEIDNLDSYTRSDGALSQDDNIDLARRYANLAHSAGLAIAQKNGAGDSAKYREQVGFDFVISEECMKYDECADYMQAYKGVVFDIEYDDPDAFATYCKDPDHPASMILRDLDLVTPDNPAYLYTTC